MSEKLDGVRAYWDGKHLISRGGKIFSAPKIFTKDFPNFELDGELWSKRNDFENISSIVRTQNSPARWSELSYNIFEVPHAEGGLSRRLENVNPYKSEYLKIIKQTVCKNTKSLIHYKKSILKLGGEGVVLRDSQSPYHIKRSNKDLKVKPYFDEECTVIGYTKGKGKYLNQVGALKCKLKDGKMIKIGSGLSDKERQNPPEIGTIITFKYYGFTKHGIPKFPVFLRIREKTDVK